ncbi:MAG: hypothetical protein WD993_07400 [Thermoleophilaceae bacterium]
MPAAIRRTWWELALLLVLVAMVSPQVADGAVRAKADPGSDVRFVLQNETLTVRVLDRPHHQVHPPVLDRLGGKRVRAACGTRFQPSEAVIVRARRRWPEGRSTLVFRFRRNISHRVRWCVIETGKSGGDVAGVSFVRREPAQLLARGRMDSGKWWRLAVWRGSRLQPCMRMAYGDGSFGICFDDDAEREAQLGTVLDMQGCRRPRRQFLLGVVPRLTATVDVLLEDALVAARVFRRPSGSRVRAKYLLSILPGDAKIRRVVARDEEGTVLGRERGDNRLAVC